MVGVSLRGEDFFSIAWRSMKIPIMKVSMRCLIRIERFFGFDSAAGASMVPSKIRKSFHIAASVVCDAGSSDEVD